MEHSEENCSTCAWHDSFSWVCFNGLSEHRADFTDPENTCRNGKKGKMKMTRDGVEYTCDKCGKTMFAPTDRCSNMNSVRERMTRDWEEVTDDQGRKRDLCPECSKEYKKIIGGFLKKK